MSDTAMAQPLNRLKPLLAEVADLGRAMSLLSWDQETYMPSGGISARAEEMATLSKIAHERFTSDEIGDLLNELDGEAAAIDSMECALVRAARRDYDRATKLPSELVSRIARETALAREVWVRARKESDFQVFRPNLETIVSLVREVADRLGHDGCRYDALLDQYEPNMRTADVRQVFEVLKRETVPFLQAISDRLDRVDRSCLHRDFDQAAQLALGEEVARLFGFDFDCGRQDLTVHPFCTGLAPGDVRITTRVYRDDLAVALFGTMHETGHGLYEQGLPVEWDRTPVCESVSLGVHESQSRFWENIVGRSRAFWQYFFPHVLLKFPHLADVGAEGIYRAANRVKPSFIRVEADELTYNFHIMLRFELECGLMDESLQVADLPEAWNARMKEYLGIVPPDDAHGVLQDIHWSGGSIGYFPTYTLGNLISAQLTEAMSSDLDFEGLIARGEFAPLLEWLRDRIHRHGRRYTPQELIRRATGSEMSADSFVRYAKGKFGELYGVG